MDPEVEDVTPERSAHSDGLASMAIILLALALIAFVIVQLVT